MNLKSWKMVLICFLVIYGFQIMSNANSPTPITTNSGSSAPLSSLGDGSVMGDPFQIQVDTFYGYNEWEEYFALYETRYLSFDVQAQEIYFAYFKPGMWWELELYDNPIYTILLGTLYPISLSFNQEYFCYSPNRTGTYYLRLYENPGMFGFSFGIFTADLYTINTSLIIIIGPEYHPVQFFQVDLEEGNYTASIDAYYAKVDRGWNYILFSDAYERFPVGEFFHLDTGSYGIIIEESCQFQLTYYPPHNETPPIDPPGENETDDDPPSFFDNLTPAFGIGILVGVLVLYKVKKK